jgi:hypothetical protein
MVSPYFKSSFTLTHFPLLLPFFVFLQISFLCFNSPPFLVTCCSFTFKELKPPSLRHPNSACYDRYTLTFISRLVMKIYYKYIVTKHKRCSLSVGNQGIHLMSDISERHLANLHLLHIFRNIIRCWNNVHYTALSWIFIFY